MGAIKATFVFDGQHYDVVAKSVVALELECAVGFADETIRRLSGGSFAFALRDPRSDNKIELIGELVRCERADDGGKVVRIWIGRNERKPSRPVQQDASPGIADAGSGIQQEVSPGIEDAGSEIEQDASPGIADAGSGIQQEVSPGIEDTGSGIGKGDEDVNSLDVGRMRAAKTIAIGGGKGGVGKTIVAVNLALALSCIQEKVTLFDGDISNCNCNTLLGITKVDGSLEEYLRKERTLDEITVSTGYPGLRLVCGAQINVDAFLPAEMPRLLNDIRQVDADCLVIDLGAGVSDETLDLYRLADDKIIIVAPQVTSLQNAYGFIKSAFFHDLKRSGGLAALLDKAGSDPQKLRALIGSLEEGHTARHAFASVLARQRFRIVGNMMNDEKDLKIIQHLQKVVGQYLHIDNTVLGTLATSEDIRKSVNRITPFLILSPDSPQSREMKRMAERLTQRTVDTPI